MVQWQCRHPACAWQGRWYEGVWDGCLYVCCPWCGDVCDPDLQEHPGASRRDQLLLPCSGACLLLLGLALLWRLWHGDPTDLLATLVLLLGALGCLGCGLVELVPARLLQRLTR